MGEDWLISVIVPVYNVEDYLKKCIESILTQTYQRLEIILVDDGSSDSSGKICDVYAQKDKRVKVIHKKNGGLVSARKAGTEIATGDYIINVDGDDWIEKNRFENLAVTGLSTGADMIYMNGYLLDYGKKVMKCHSNVKPGIFQAEEIEQKVLSKIIDCRKSFSTIIFPAMWMWAIRRNILQKNQKLVNDVICRAEDQMCNYFCLLSSKKVTVIEEGGYHYVQRESSIIHKGAKLSVYWYSELKRFLQEQKAGESDFLRAVFLTVYMIIMTDYAALLNYNTECIFPFLNIKKGCKIVIYGAGKVGDQLVRELASKKEYEIVGWIDNNEKLQGSIRYGYRIQSIDILPMLTFDWILIAVINQDIADSIKKGLKDRKISENHIAVMSAGMMKETVIPPEYRQEIK